MKALVIGGTGLIGAYIVRALLKRGDQVRILARHPERLDRSHAAAAEIVVGDILTSDEALQNACTGQDVVFHAAARFAYERSRSTEIFDTAVRGTENVLRTCAQVGAGRVVVTSSSVVFGYSSVPAEIDESKEIVFTSEPPYVAAKIEQHRRSLSLAAELNLNVVLACPTMTLGPTRGDLGPSNGMILAYLADPFRCTYRGGCNLVSGRDIAEGHILLGQHGVSGQAYLLGGENLHWEAIHTAIADLAGVQRPLFRLNHTLAYLAATAEEARASFVGRTPLSTREQAAMIGRWYWYSDDRAQALGYRPGSGEMALIQTISWLAASHHMARETRTSLRLSAEIYQFRASAADSNDQRDE